MGGFFVVVVICIGFSSVFKAVSGLLRDAILVILWAILLSIKWSVASAIFWIAIFKADLSASVVIN